MTGGLLRSPNPWGRALEAFFLLHALLLPISIAAGQIWAYLIAAVTIAGYVRGVFKGAGRSPLLIPILCFAAAALFSAFVGLRPELAFRKSDRLLLAAVAIAAPIAVAGSARVAAPNLIPRMLAVFLIGCTAKALYDLVRIPLKFVWAMRAFDAATAAGQSAVPPSIFAIGNMRDPQFYAVAICIALALWLMRAPGYRPELLLGSLCVCVIALVLHFKRGAWASALAALVLMAILTRRWRLLGTVVLAIAILSQLPMVQARIGQLREEFHLESGGRIALWTKVAPELFREFPLGIGWRSVRHEDLLECGVPVQRGLNHLHDNLLHVRLETGWYGLAAWLFWMGSAAFLMVRAYRHATHVRSDLTGPALGTLCAFAALHANGLVEYNFGDAEIFMLMNWLMGVGAALWVLQASAALRPAESDLSATPAGTPGR